MARVVIEDMVLFLIALYLLSSIIFAIPIFDSLVPGEKYNTATNSFEPYTRDTTSMFGDNSETLELLNSTQNVSIVSSSGLIDPLAIVKLVGAYISLLINTVGSTYLYFILKTFMGSTLATAVTFLLNLMIFVVGLRVLSGRIRWD
jgi:hypothetical protein